MAQQQIDESEEHEQNLPRDGGPMVRTLVEATIRSLCALQAKSHRCRSPQRPSWPTAATTDENGDVSGQARAFLVRTSPSQRLTRGPSRHHELFAASTPFSIAFSVGPAGLTTLTYNSPDPLTEFPHPEPLPTLLETGGAPPMLTVSIAVGPGREPLGCWHRRSTWKRRH